MVKQFLFSIFIAWGLISCGVKKPPTPLYAIPITALKTIPTPSPTPAGN